MSNYVGAPYWASPIATIAEEVIRELEAAQRSVPSGARFTRTLRVECVANTLRGFLREGETCRCGHDRPAHEDGKDRCRECAKSGPDSASGLFKCELFARQP